MLLFQALFLDFISVAEKVSESPTGHSGPGVTSVYLDPRSFNLFMSYASLIVTAMHVEWRECQREQQKQTHDSEQKQKHTHREVGFEVIEQTPRRDRPSRGPAVGPKRPSPR